MVEVNLDLSPTLVAQLGQPLNQPLVILLRGIEIGVSETPSLVIAIGFEVSGILLTPIVQTLFLDRSWRVSSVLPRHTAGFEMVGQRDHQVNPAARRPASQPLP